MSLSSSSLDGRTVASDAKKQRQEANLGHHNPFGGAVSKILLVSRFMTVLCPFAEWAQTLCTDNELLQKHNSGQLAFKTPFVFVLYIFGLRNNFLKLLKQSAEENDDDEDNREV